MWSRPVDGMAMDRLDTARRLGWTPLALYDLAREVGRETLPTLFRRSHEFVESWLAYRRSLQLASFVAALRADIGAITRVPQDRRLPPAAARQAVYREKIQPKLPPDLLDALPFEILPDDVHLATMQAAARAHPKPDAATYFHDLIDILRAAGLGPMRAARWAYDHIICNLGLDLMDEQWVAIWRQIQQEEEQQAGMRQETLTEP